MNYSFNTRRSASLDVALVVGADLQKSLDAAKHGYSSNKAGIINIRSLLYGSAGRVSTIGVDYNTCDYLVKFKWYSNCNVKLADLKPCITNNHGMISIHISNLYMNLYSISAQNIEASMTTNTRSKSSKIVCQEDDQGCVISSRDFSYDVNTMYIRKTILDCSIDDITTVSIDNKIYSIIQGDKYANMYQLCDELLCTNISTMISYIGKVNTNIVQIT